MLTIGTLPSLPGVTIWRIPLELPEAELPELAALLSADERARAERFRPPGARRRFVVAHGWLRRILGAALDADPVALVFSAGPWGKPTLSGPWAAAGIQFNLSHSHELALLAVTTGRAVGVDLERLRPIPRATQLAERYFAAPERADLARMAGTAAEATTFFNCWTRKEAFVKAQGQGLAWPLDSFAVSCLPGEAARLTWCREGAAEAARWQLAELAAGDGYVGAVVVEAPADILPPLPQTAWEKPTSLAAAMAQDKESFVRALMPHSLTVAGRAAALPAVRPHLSAGLFDELRWALVARSRDLEAALRERIAAGYAAGDLGDPRWERKSGPFGDYLLPPVAEVPGGMYPIGADQPIFDAEANEWQHGHMPRHLVPVDPFAMGCFAVTNAEWACFMAAGGYEDERWWVGADALAWRRGEGTAEGPRLGARQGLSILRDSPEMLESWLDSGRIDDDGYQRWLLRLAMSTEAFDAHLTALYPGGRLTEPLAWGDRRFNRPTQPVVGVSWYEARAYCAWLAAQTGAAWRLPTEVEREAATGGPTGSSFVYGDAFDALGGNTLETHLRQTSPAGVFVAGDSLNGISDLAGNSADWNSSLWGRFGDKSDYPYPYDGSDGREDAFAGPDIARVLRGGSWDADASFARAAGRDRSLPADRGEFGGFRVVRASPTAPVLRSPMPRSAASSTSRKVVAVVQSAHRE
ncbi:MAG: SUMF1/EgtB/PvdO family nonheme iron enzyme [Ardenticatenia bacterium]|nr:SUMF1/EgtB/PvdO family nonheme iron enzyme [Ardenticatenia bacterium]